MSAILKNLIKAGGMSLVIPTVVSILIDRHLTKQENTQNVTCNLISTDMIKYIVTLSESDGETIVGRYDSLEEAQQHLRSVRYYPEYRRTAESLDIDEDGMSGSGYDENGHFTYNIKTEAA